MADERQAREAEAALHLTNALLAAVDAYIGRQPGGEMPVAVVADGVAGLAGFVAASGVEELRAAGEGLDAEQLPLEMCRVLLGTLGGEADAAGDSPLLMGGLPEAEIAQAQALREALEEVLDERAQQETLSVDVVVDAVGDLLMRTLRRVVQQLAQAGDTDGARTRLVTCYRLVQQSLETLATGDLEAKDGA
jgi:hypothetical protein